MIANSSIWFCCVEINDTNKVYFKNQVAGFATPPLVVTWKDQQPNPPEATHVVTTPWSRQLNIRGGARLRRAAQKIWSRANENIYASGKAELKELETLAQRHPPSVIYAHTGFVGLRLLPLAERLSVPVVVHSHGLDINTSDTTHLAAFTRSLPRFARILVVANWMRPWFEERGVPPEKIDVLPMGVPVDDITATPIPETTTSFVVVGMHGRVKSIETSIAAIGKLRHSHPQARLRLVGTGPETERLKALADQVAPGAVDFLGLMRSQEALAEVSSSLALVITSRDKPNGPEAFPTVVSEAMALGRPVIGTQCGGIPDQVIDGETGFLIPQGGVDELTRAMSRLLDNPDQAQEMGYAGRRRAERLLDSVALARNAEAILMVVASEEKTFLDTNGSSP